MTRYKTSRAIGKLGPIAIPHLLKALKAKDDNTSHQASIAFGGMKKRAAWRRVAHEKLIQLLRSLTPTQKQTRKRTLYALTQLGLSPKRWIKALNTTDQKWRAALIEILSGAYDDATKKALQKAMRHGPQHVRVAATIAFVKQTYWHTHPPHALATLTSSSIRIISPLAASACGWCPCSSSSS